MKNSKKLSQQYQQLFDYYRTLRTNLDYSVINEECKVFLFVSHGLNEKMAPIIGNLGLVFAKIGKRVLIIEGDLHRPRLHRYFNRNKELGLSNILGQELSLDDAIDKVEYNLHLLTSGTLPLNPHLLIQSPQMERLLCQLKQSYDVILISSPPMCFVHDALVLATKVSGVLMLVEKGKSKVSKVKACQKQLKQVNATLLGSIMTNSEPIFSYYEHYSLV